MNKNIFRIIFFITTILMFIIIFGFSNQNGKDSERKSRKIAVKMVSLKEEIRNEKYYNREIQINKMDHKIRKTAHFTLYTISGISLMSFLIFLEIENKKSLIISIIIGLIYATSDEIHQIFIPERTAYVSDILIDTCGIIFGSFIVLIIIKKSTKKSKKIQNNVI